MSGHAVKTALVPAGLDVTVYTRAAANPPRDRCSSHSIDASQRSTLPSDAAIASDAS